MLYHKTSGEKHVSCNRTYDKIGCFRKKIFFGVQLFRTLVMTDRDWSAEQYGGQEIDWSDWANYIHG